ncbi:hypothetical protein F4X33_09055 [Candidatus Poribacteria bacterium]|nr:hypothetical protein [Candidatus Poribacteria bacterium]
MHTHFCHTAFILALCILLVSCGPPPQTGKLPPIPSANRSQPASASAATKARTASSAGTLPASAAVDVTKKPLLKAFFRSPPDVTRIEDLYGTTRGKVQNLSIVSNCDMDVLKAFLATGWAPIILSRRSGKGYLTTVMRYDDADQQIQLGNPLGVQRRGLHTRAGRTLAYSDFEKEWTTGSRRTCVLVTPKKLNDASIRAALKKYLPENQVARVQVRSR